MLDRLGPPARRAADRAWREARGLGHDHVGTEHLLLGIVAAGDSVAAGVMRAHGLTAAALRDKVAEAVSPGEAGAADLSLTDRAQRALERASRLSLRHGESAVGTVAVAVSVIDVEGTAGQVLRGLGADIPALRADLLAATDDGTPASSPVPAEGLPSPAPDVPTAAQSEDVPPPTCGGCGRELSAGLRLITMSAVDPAGATRPVTVVTCATCGVAIGATLVAGSPG